MTGKAREQPVDVETLGDFLRVLSYPARLELLGLLRFPHTLSEVRLSPRRSQRGENPERAASKQAVHVHLQKLLEADLVRSDLVEQDGRKVPQYVVNPSRFYALIEDLRRLSTIYAGRGAATDVTGTLGPASEVQAVRGPRLVLVHGVYEGKAFPLSATAAQAERWTIGRRRGLPVTLDYDPFVSLEHAVVAAQGKDFVLHDLPKSKNGTAVNWALLPPGGSRVLEPGDVVGVGRSLLCFASR